jgi:hypothetical protein
LQRETYLSQKLRAPHHLTDEMTMTMIDTIVGIEEIEVEVQEDLEAVMGATEGEDEGEGGTGTNF